MGLQIISLEEQQEEFATFEIGGTVFALHGVYEAKIRENNVAIHFVVKDIREEVTRLKSKGVEFTKEIHKMPWGAYQATFSDSDGNKMDITQHPEGGPIM